jgi:hypothetical protein
MDATARYSRSATIRSVRPDVGPAASLGQRVHVELEAALSRLKSKLSPKFIPIDEMINGNRQ